MPIPLRSPGHHLAPVAQEPLKLKVKDIDVSDKLSGSRKSNTRPTMAASSLTRTMVKAVGALQHLLAAV
jgi:hypothetical protein